MSAARRSIAFGLVFSAFAMLGAPARGDAPSANVEWASTAPIDRAVSLPLRAGQELTVRGALRSSFDGTVLDAATRTEPVNGAMEMRPGGLFDLAGSGLAVMAWDPATHETRLAVSDAPAPLCEARGLSAPCLVPRIDALAHDRLLSVDEFRSTLSGDVRIAAHTPAEPPVLPRILRAAAPIAIGLVAAALAALAFALRNARRSTAFGQVGVAAAEARIATRGDPMLAPVAAQIEELVRRARDHEAARRACASKLAKIDRDALAKKRAAWSVSTAPEAAEVLAWVTAEEAEAARLAADLGASIVGIERIASALRVVTLRARSHRGVRIRVAGTRAADPVDTVATELALRDEAIAEAERIA